MLEGYFRLKEHGTTVGTEVVAGLTTFMVMAYIIFVNPAILSFAGIPALQAQGVPFAPTLAATCLVALDGRKCGPRRHPRGPSLAPFSGRPGRPGLRRCAG